VKYVNFFIAWDENKSCVNGKKLEFISCLLYLLSWFDLTVWKSYALIVCNDRIVRRDNSVNTEIMFHCREKYFYSENTENENMHFILSIFLNISFISIKHIYLSCRSVIKLFDKKKWFELYKQRKRALKLSLHSWHINLTVSSSYFVYVKNGV
jgi:hypothetical protein